jgi:hypothetical protein
LRVQSTRRDVCVTLLPFAKKMKSTNNIPLR